MRFKKLLTMALSAALAAALAFPAAASTLTDINQSWAKAEIQALVDDNVISGYPDNTFRPDKTVTRGEFAKMLTKAFNLKADKSISFKDTKDHWAEKYVGIAAANNITTGYSDGTFRPNAPITRAEMVVMVNRALGLEQELKDVDISTDTGFSDVKSDFWAAKSIATASQLGLLPSNIITRFQPQKEATRAETASMIYAARTVKTYTGTLIEAEEVGMVTVKPLASRPVSFDITPDTLVFRNNIPAEGTDLIVGDRVWVLADETGTPKLVKANGIVSRKDVVDKIGDVTAEITREILTQDQVQAILAGDWGKVSEGLRYNLYDRLTAMGLKPWEAEAILAQDWDSLSGSAKDRLASAVSDMANLSPELTLALINRDWESVKTYGQVELTQKFLSGLLF